MRKSIVILGLTSLLLTCSSCSKTVEVQENNRYIEHVVHPDGTMSEKYVDEDQAEADIQHTIKRGPTNEDSWVSYVENPDGTYTSRLGVTYKYMKNVKVNDTEYWVFSNKEDVTKEDALKLLAASSDANYIQWGMEPVYMK